MMRPALVLYQLRSRTVLVGLALILLVLNLGRVTVNYFNNRQEMVANRVALLQQQRRTVADLDTLRQRVEALRDRKEQIETFFFTGESQEKVASAMQIALQEKVAKTALEPESLRPIMRARKEKDDRDYQELAIKLRLSGSLQDFLDFIAELYRSKHLFLIESFVIKPTRKDLKILMDLKGFYKLTGSGEKGKQ